jgi:hypothetical protein
VTNEEIDEYIARVENQTQIDIQRIQQTTETERDSLNKKYATRDMIGDYGGLLTGIVVFLCIALIVLSDLFNLLANIKIVHMLTNDDGVLIRRRRMFNMKSNKSKHVEPKHQQTEKDHKVKRKQSKNKVGNDEGDSSFGKIYFDDLEYLDPSFWNVKVFQNGQANIITGLKPVMDKTRSILKDENKV